MFFLYYGWLFFYFFINNLVFFLNKFKILNNFFINFFKNNYLMYYLKLVFIVNKFNFSWMSKKHPILFFFKLFQKKFIHSNNDLKFLVKQFKYFSKSFFYKTIKVDFFLKHFEIKNIFLVFIILQNLFFKNYYNFYYSLYFNNPNKFNFIKLNWVFYFFLINSNSHLYVFDLNRYFDWYKFNFNSSAKFISKKSIKDFWVINFFKKVKKNKFNYFLKIYKIYNTNYKFVKILGINYKNIFLLKLKNFYNLKFIFRLNLKNLKLLYPTRFSESSVNKLIELKNLSSYNFFFLRKNRIFNKSRYSRNRQLYRTGVYWCLWLNIVIIYGLFFLFYRFTFNFGYIWFGVLVLFYSFIFSKVLKYNFVNIFIIIKEFFFLISWLGLICLNFLLFFKSFFITYFNLVNKLSYLNNYLVSSNLFLNFFNYKLVVFLINFFNKLDLVNFTILWQEMKEKDVSFLRYKTVLHFFKQLLKIHTMV